MLLWQEEEKTLDKGLGHVRILIPILHGLLSGLVDGCGLRWRSMYETGWYISWVNGNSWVRRGGVVPWT